MMNIANTNPAATNPAPATKPAAVGGITRVKKPAPAAVDNAAALAEKSAREAAAEERRAHEAEAEKREAEKREAEKRAYNKKCDEARKAEARAAKNAPKPSPYAADIDRAAEAAKSAREAADEAADALAALDKLAAEKPAAITHEAARDEAREAAARAEALAEKSEAAAKLAAALAVKKSVKGGKAAAIKSAADTAEAEAAAARKAAADYSKAAARAIADYTATEQRMNVIERITAGYNGKQSSRDIWHDFAAVNFAAVPNRDIFIKGLGEERGKAYYVRIMNIFSDFIALLAVYGEARHKAAINKSDKAAAAKLAEADKAAFDSFKSIIALLHLTNGENIGYNADTINTLCDKAYNYAYRNKKNITEGYKRAHIAPAAMLNITLKTLCAADTIAAAARAAADKAAKRKADKAARAAKNAARAAALEKAVDDIAPEVAEAETALNKAAAAITPEKPAADTEALAK